MSLPALDLRRPLLVTVLGGLALLLPQCTGQQHSPANSAGAGGAGADGAGHTGTGSKSPGGAGGSLAGGAGNNGLPEQCPVVPSSLPPPVLDCTFAAAGTEPKIDDFNDGDLFIFGSESRIGSWYTFTDETAGCLQSEVSTVGSSRALHLSGQGFSNWGVGFGTSLAWSMSQNGLCTYDVSAYSGLRFRARGNAILRVNLPSRESAFQSAGGDCPDSEGCFDQQGRSVALSADFQEFEIPFCSLSQAGFGAPLGPLDLAQVTNINFLIQTTNRFDVWIDDVEFIPRNGKPTTACGPVCPSDELALGITPQPDKTSIDQEQTGVRLYTFEQPTPDCGPITRRYLSYAPDALGPSSDAPVVILLHGHSAEAESMQYFITKGRFEELARRDGFVVVYGNAAPGTGTVAERPNGGGFRKDPSARTQVDDFAYLEQITADLTARGIISGKNPLFLAGLSDGGGMTHMAALNAPGRYTGIAELMPYPGSTVELPDPKAGFELSRVLLGYTVGDPGLPAGYDAKLAPLGAAWAKAIGLSSADQASPHVIALPNPVNEGESYTGSVPAAVATRDSSAEQTDYGSDPSGPLVRVIRFDHAGHLWPEPNPIDRMQEVALFGFRNQDMDMSDVVWDFFRSAL